MGLCHEQCVQIVPFKTSKVPLKVLLLHGNFDIWVKEAKNLPNMDLFHSKLGDIFRRLPQNVCSKIEESMSDKITSDPYVTISVSDAVIGRTFVISNSENPIWMQHFYVPVAHYAAEVHFVVKDSDVIGSQIIGAVGIPVEQLFSGAKVEGTFPILNACGKPCKAGAVLNLSIQYTPMDRVSLYHGGVGSGPEYSGVPGTYFPLRKAGKVTLYQDAHVGDGCLPDVRLDRGLQYVHGDCWSDIYEAIKQARRLIYIIGWSVDHSVQLVRDDDGEEKDSSLGELLKNKSQEGVRVLLLVWDDPTSWSILGYKTNAEPMEEWQNDLSVQLLPFLNSKKPMKVMLLHGNLDIWVKDAKNLPNMDFDFSIGMSNTWLGGSKGKKTNKETSDPYVTISVANAVIGRTFVIDNSEHPVWMQRFYVPVAHYAAEVHFVVKDDDLVGSQILGLVGIPVEQICYGKKLEGTYPVLNASGKPCKAGAVLTLSIQYIPIHKIPIYQGGLGSGSEYQGVPGTYFPLRRGGRVKLYQDAHVSYGCLPHLNLDNEAEYVHGTCWRDIYEAIGQARTLVYITGWSVYHSVRLIRDDVNITDSSLGDLLKQKSQVGVRVLLLIWDDPTSTNMWGYKTDGIMQTGDEETRRFFKHSSVQVLLCPRSAGEGHSWAKKKEVGTIYTHHQKTVIVDADAGNYKRKIIAFVGGLDLCVGRYDTPRHPIFSTLQTVHKDDYHNPNYTGPTAGCPREPWHDLHSRVEGPAAYDVLTNFEERWLKASKPRGLKKMKTSFDDSLLKIERIPDILRIDDAECVTEDDPEGWHVQVFRSIDTNSVKGFPKDPKDAPSRNLVCGKNVLIDMSIHTAYVKAIRAAQHFIYIENQYFLGSSYNWNSYKTLGANNLIPMEIALKIANKIKANERFCAYIVIPMWPEGSPTSTATQRILFWQHNTMQMMYEVIYKALEEMGLEKQYEPQDYLNFFCLGNREVQGSEAASNGGNTNSTATPQALSRKNRRFMIYVHSKGMIVDDEFVILGSANINQRSLEGTRDTEIAMGAYQPHHTWGRKGGSPHGQIYGYRMSLWAEHIGRVEECFERPESLECVRRVRGVGEQNWSQFAADEITDMKGHLLKYPVEVDRTGKVKPLPGCPTFPDVGGTIVGTFTAIQENLTI